MTKLNMARVIVTALYGKTIVVAADHPEALRRAQHGTVASLTFQHGLAIRAIQSAQTLRNEAAA